MMMMVVVVVIMVMMIVVAGGSECGVVLALVSDSNRIDGKVLV